MAYPQFSWEHVKVLPDSEPAYFTGEMVFMNVFGVDSVKSDGSSVLRYSLTCSMTIATFAR